jgi:CBS domain-containing protein
MPAMVSPSEWTELVARQRWEELRAKLERTHVSDVAEMLTELPPKERAIVFRLVARERAAEVFGYLALSEQRELIHSLTADEVKRMLNAMRPDDRTRFFGEMPAEVTRKLLEELSPEELRESRELLGYPSESVGRYMTPHYVSISADMTAGEALEHIRKVGHKSETLNVVYILDANGKLLEDLRLGSLVLADPHTKVAEIADPALVSLHAMDDRETALELFEKYDRVALPVTDAQGNMLGIVTVDDMLDVAQSEATEDIQKRFGSAGCAVHTSGFVGHDSQAGRLAIGAVSGGDADGHGNVIFRRRNCQSSSAGVVCAPGNQQRWEFRLAGGVADHSRVGVAGIEFARLVPGVPQGVDFRTRVGVHAGRNWIFSHCIMATSASYELRHALFAAGVYGLGQLDWSGDVRNARGKHVAFHFAWIGIRPGGKFGSVCSHAGRCDGFVYLFFRGAADPSGNAAVSQKQ